MSQPPNRILVVGAEQQSEFADAVQEVQQGNQVTVVNPIVTDAAQRYSAHGGDFRPIRLEALAPRPHYHQIRENYPYPLGRTPQAIAFSRQRLARLLPGGRWVVITENREFAEALRDIAMTHGFSTTLVPLSFHRAPPSSPRYIHPLIRERYRLTIRKPIDFQW